MSILQESGADIGGFNMEAKESSKSDECNAICELRGVSASAPLSLQLKVTLEKNNLYDNFVF